jgi:cysteine-rich repeat protein
VVCDNVCASVAGDTDLCGDSIIDATETCDDGNALTESCTYGLTSCSVCNGACLTAAGATSYCGDGIVQSTEACDDGNTVNTDTCTNACVVRIGQLGDLCTANAQCLSGNCATEPPGTANDRCSPTGMVYFPAETFNMGSPAAELGRDADETQHNVTFSRAFFIARTETTQSQWFARANDNPSRFTGGTCGTDTTSTCPIENIDWYSALEFANARSTAEGLTSCYTVTGCANPGTGWRDGQYGSCSGANFVGLTCTGYRLPTESEWEIAYRAGTTTGFYNGEITSAAGPDALLGLIAWYNSNSTNRTRVVGGKTANAWGLFDMAGNVKEYVWDRYGAYPGTVTDPLGAATGANRVVRGGGWNSAPSLCRAASRETIGAAAESSSVGFRLVRTVP